MSLFHAIMQTKPQAWTHTALAACSLRELRLLSKLSGIGSSGTHPYVLLRLWCCLQLRIRLVGSSTDMDAQADVLSKQYKRTELVAMARIAQTYFSLPKRGIAVGLLNWREHCRMRGQAFLVQYRIGQRQRQLRLPLGFDLPADPTSVSSDIVQLAVQLRYVRAQRTRQGSHATRRTQQDKDKETSCSTTTDTFIFAYNQRLML